MKISLLLAGVAGFDANLLAQTNIVSNQIPSRIIPVKVTSPIEYFRELLAMKPVERTRELASKTPEQQKILTAKIQEYEAMTAEERELRLRMTQLRWYLLPLMKVPKIERGRLFASIPAADRELVERRLKLWDEVPAHLQKEFLENEINISYFVKWEGSTPEQRTKMLETFPPERRAQWENELNKWNQTPTERRQEMCNRFTQFFELDEKEKNKTLSSLSEAERQQMEKTLQSFSKLPTIQRAKCIESFRKFASMTPAEREEFLRNAGRWQTMTPSERQAWRELVQHNPPMPPLPRLLPPLPSRSLRVPLVTTNTVKATAATAGH